jgi:hypothetical protein
VLIIAVLGANGAAIAFDRPLRQLALILAAARHGRNYVGEPKAFLLS